jgi:hypothetical protein
LLERGVGLGDVAGLGQDEGHGVLGGRDDVGLRRVDDHDAAPSGGIEVDVVEADARSSHHQQGIRRLQHLGRHLGGRADDQRVGPRDRLEEPFGRQVQLDIDVVAGGP